MNINLGTRTLCLGYHSGVICVLYPYYIIVSYYNFLKIALSAVVLVPVLRRCFLEYHRVALFRTYSNVWGIILVLYVYCIRIILLYRIIIFKKWPEVL